MAYHKLTSQIQEILSDKQVWFETFEHEEVRTSEEAVKLRHGYTIHQGAKALILKIKTRNGEKKFIMCVLPGDARLQTSKVKQVTQSKEIRFATPDEVFEITGGVVPGGVPPFGNLFHLPVFVDISLLQNEKIVFNAGDRKFSIAMKAMDYESIVQPVVESIVE